MIQIEPAIVAADLCRLGVQAVEAEAAGVESLQVDVIDGHFLPNITVGPGTVKALRSLVHIKINVHLMTNEPERFIQKFIDSGADRIIIHFESCSRIRETIAKIRTQNVSAGIALMPDTSVDSIRDFLNLIDYIQILTADPMAEGSIFIDTQLEKIQYLDKIVEEYQSEIKIGADGGIDAHSAPELVKAGADVLVIGRNIYQQSGPVFQNINKINDAIEKALLQ